MESVWKSSECCFLLKVCHFTSFLLKSVAESHDMLLMEAALPGIFRVEPMSVYLTGTDPGIFCRIPISMFNRSVYCRAIDEEGLVEIRNPEVFPEFFFLVLILTVVKLWEIKGCKQRILYHGLKADCSALRYEILCWVDWLQKRIFIEKNNSNIWNHNKTAFY